MDVTPEWHSDWTKATCVGQARLCAGGDLACSAAAERDGYVAVSSYAFCRPEDVRTEPGLTGYLAMVALGLAVFAAGFAWSRWSRTRKRAPET